MFLIFNGFDGLKSAAGPAALGFHSKSVRKNAGLADAMPLCFSILVKRQVSDAAYDFCSQFLG